MPRSYGILKILHLSAECYPAAKVGGLADVVGSLPKYLNKLGTEASVLIPKYGTDWIQSQTFEKVSDGHFVMGNENVSFEIQKTTSADLGFPLYLVDIPGLFDRPGVYGDPQGGQAYDDEAERFIAFQRAALQWMNAMPEKPDIVHCHDHHTGLVPFMMTQCQAYDSLKYIPTVLTVHNAEYQGIYSHDKQRLLPKFNRENVGLLDWDGALNSLAAGLKCCWQISTVSPSYMKELRKKSNGLERLFAGEQQKSRGILNGIDEQVWNPADDHFLKHHYTVQTLSEGKEANKKILCKQFSFENDRPLISFIGRLVHEKGADLLPDLFTSVIKQNHDVSFIVLGTGNPELHQRFRAMNDRFVGFFDASLHYNEELAHQIYAGSDFLVMPSRVEPCGLNQMYAMRYGTVPLVHTVGGLKDTVRDLNQPGGYGICFDYFTLEAARKAIKRALALYKREEDLAAIRKKIMQLDFSWNASAVKYITLYKQLKEQAL